MASVKRTVLLAFTLLGVQAARADCPPPPCWSETPVLVVGASPGGTSDALARALADAMAAVQPQQVMVDNKSGLGGNVAVDWVAKARPDGATALFAPTTVLTVNPLLYTSRPIDTGKTLRPVSLVAELPFVLVVNPAVNASSLKQFVDLVKGGGGTSSYSYASNGNGGYPNLLAELLKQNAGLSKLAHVPYKGAGPALADLLGGAVQAAFIDVPMARPHLQAGKLRALAVTGATRSPTLPDVPTFAESGFPQLRSLAYGLLYPPQTPADAIDRMDSVLRRAEANDAYRARFSALGLQPAERGAIAFARHLETESTRWATTIKAAGIKIE